MGLSNEDNTKKDILLSNAFRFGRYQYMPEVSAIKLGFFFVSMLLHTQVLLLSTMQYY